MKILVLGDVSVHYVDAGIDRDDSLAQRSVNRMRDDTLRTGYDRLSREIQGLFEEVRPGIREGKRQAVPRSGARSLTDG